MSTGAPSLTISFSAGIWLSIVPSGSGGVGAVLPIVRPLSRSAFSASERFMPTTLGTVSLPSPTAISTETCSPSSASSPAAGVWPMTEPAGALGSTFSFGAAASLNPASVSFFSASNVDLAPTTSGTTAFLGSSM